MSQASLALRLGSLNLYHSLDALLRWKVQQRHLAEDLLTVGEGMWLETCSSVIHLTVNSVKCSSVLKLN